MKVSHNDVFFSFVQKKKKKKKKLEIIWQGGVGSCDVTNLTTTTIKRKKHELIFSGIM